MDTKIEYALMAKDTEEKAVAPADVSAAELNGWNVVGTAEVDADGKITAVTGRVIETPAHVIETADHFLKTIPKFDAPLPVVMPLAVQKATK
jgi:hypothetical protein